MISAVAPVLGISGMDFEGCYYITFRMEKADEYKFISTLCDHFGGGGYDAACLVSPKELPSFEKYDEYVPAELLRHAYATDRLNADEAGKRLMDIKKDILRHD
jgi:ATP-dependent Lhr-like helicase